jgi:hypothetical protein
MNLLGRRILGHDWTPHPSAVMESTRESTRART